MYSKLESGTKALQRHVSGPATHTIYLEEKKAIWDHEPAYMKVQSDSTFHLITR